jgi:hypothetical protein
VVSEVLIEKAAADRACGLQPLGAFFDAWLGTR